MNARVVPFPRRISFVSCREAVFIFTADHEMSCCSAPWSAVYEQVIVDLKPNFRRKSEKSKSRFGSGPGRFTSDICGGVSVRVQVC